MKPICVPCKLFFRCERVGVHFEEGMPVQGVEGEKAWDSYKLWMGDLWKCTKCGAQIIVGVGLSPVAEHFQSNYQLRLSQHRPLLRVDDC